MKEKLEKARENRRDVNLTVGQPLRIDTSFLDCVTQSKGRKVVQTGPAHRTLRTGLM
jgi:hypothetical protein